MKYKIFFIFLAAFLIRLIALNQSLWLDEAITAKVVSHFSYLEILTKYSPFDFHPPLFYWIEKFWTNIFGYSEVSLRLPSLIFSLLTGYVIYLSAGIWAASLFLFNPLVVYYSQEARMYMMATFFLTAGLYYFIKNRNVILFNLFIFLSLLTFYGSIFLVMAFLLYFLFKRQYKNLFISLFVIFLYFLLIFPLLYQQLINSKIVLNGVTNWTLVLGKSNLKNLLLIPIKFSIGRISFYPKWIYWSISVIWTGLVFLRIKTVFKKNSLLWFYLLIFPLILGFFVSFFSPMLQYFRFLYLVPIMAIILASEKNNSMLSTCLPAGRYIIVTGFVVFSLTYLLLPQFHREDWKSLVINLPKDKPVYMIRASSDPVFYYSNSLKINELTNLRVENKEKEITVIPFSAGVYGLDYKKDLIKKGFRQKEVKNFRELQFEIWRRR